MISPGQKFRLLFSGFTLKEILTTAGILVVGLLTTIASVYITRRNIEKASIRDFEYSCNQIRIKIETRLEQHSQLLRGGKGLFAVSDTVTREEWQGFFTITKINQYLPGIQGLGYTIIVKPEDVDEHEKRFRKVYSDYKPDYEILPGGERDLYTSIILLEPHNERNRAAIGFDMYSESIRREAMELARDSNMSVLTDKVTLVQEIDEDKQAGVLMYNPDYVKGMPIETVEQRRAAIRGWVYSPYRMRDLMQGIMGSMDHYQQEPVRLQIYDNKAISPETLLYDSQHPDSALFEDPNLQLRLETYFRGKTWTLIFSGRKEEMSFFQSQLFIWFTGSTITLLLIILSIMQIRAHVRTREIEVLNLQLERLNADKDRFIAILSHDLKSPFTSILGFLEVLTTRLRKLDIDQIESHMNIINDAAKNTFNLLQDLLMWTRAHSGKIPFNPEMIKVRDKIENIASLVMPEAQLKNINLEFNVPEGLVIYADKDMLKAILRNLVSNAIKFTGEGGSVKVSVFRENNGSTFSVADTGIGISPEQQSDIFNMSKVSPTQGTRGEKGSGLGLLLSKEFVDIHGGTIWFTSEPGKGSDFKFHLPG